MPEYNYQKSKTATSTQRDWLGNKKMTSLKPGQIKSTLMEIQKSPQNTSEVERVTSQRFEE